MAFGQLYGVTGKRPRSNYEAVINAKTPYLRSLYAQRDQQKRQQDLDAFNKEYLAWQKESEAANQALQDQQLALQQQGLDQTAAHQSTQTDLDKAAQELEDQRLALEKSQLGLTQEQIDAEKDAAAKANKLGYLNLGLNTAMGFSRMGGSGGLASLFEDAPTVDTTPAVMPSAAAGYAGGPETLPSAANTGYPTAQAAPAYTDTGAASDLADDDLYAAISADTIPAAAPGGFWSDLGDAATQASTWASGITGAATSGVLSDAIFGESNSDWAQPLTGFLTGALGGLLSSGWDMYSGAASGILGGLGSLIF